MKKHETTISEELRKSGRYRQILRLLRGVYIDDEHILKYVDGVPFVISMYDMIDDYIYMGKYKKTINDDISDAAYILIKALKKDLPDPARTGKLDDELGNCIEPLAMFWTALDAVMKYKYTEQLLFHRKKDVSDDLLQASAVLENLLFYLYYCNEDKGYGKDLTEQKPWTIPKTLYKKEECKNENN